MNISFFVQFTDSSWRNFATPQGFDNIFYPAYRNSSKIHLDQCFFYAAFTAAITLDDSSFKRNSFQPRDVKSNFSRSGGKVPIIMPTAITLTNLITFIAGCLCQSFRFSFKKFIQCFFYAGAN